MEGSVSLYFGSLFGDFWKNGNICFLIILVMTQSSTRNFASWRKSVAIFLTHIPSPYHTYTGIYVWSLTKAKKCRQYFSDYIRPLISGGITSQINTAVKLNTPEMRTMILQHQVAQQQPIQVKWGFLNLNCTTTMAAIFSLILPCKSPISWTFLPCSLSVPGCT